MRPSVSVTHIESSSKRTVDVSVTGQRAVQETIDSMYQIKEKVEGIAENSGTNAELAHPISLVRIAYGL